VSLLESYVVKGQYSVTEGSRWGEDWGDPPLDDATVCSTNKRLLTGRQFTTNISTRGVPWRLESTDISFCPGFRPGSRCGSLRRSPDLLAGWGGGTLSLFPTS